jgi:hypothetical protein
VLLLAAVRRLLMACSALRTNLTVRELAAVVGLSKSTVHRIVAALTPGLAALGRPPADRDRRGCSGPSHPVFRGNRIVRDRDWRRHRRCRVRVEHTLARLKDWRVLRDHRRPVATSQRPWPPSPSFTTSS